jgi:ABC-type transporter MlaC component
MCSFLFVERGFGITSDVSTASRVQNTTDSRVFVGGFVDSTLKIIHKPNITSRQITNESIPLMDSHVDIEAIAKFSVGPKYRELSPDERKIFLKCFRNMLASRFSLTLKSALDKYKSVNVKFIVNEVKVVKKDRQYIVISTIFVNTDEVNINWSVFIVNGSLKILNMSVGGIDLGQVLREEIGAGIKQSGLKGFLKDFEIKYGK